MSEAIESGFNLESAVKFNADHAVLRWGDAQFNNDLVEEFPGLRTYPNTEDFARETLKLQQAIFDDTEEHDGKFGAGTWAAAQARYLHVSDEPNEYIIRGGGKVPVECDTPLITWDEDGGLDLHRDGGWSRRSRRPDLVVVHWGGRNAKSCRNALAGRDLSSHFGVDRGVIYQWLDCTHKAWHAGKPNTRSIGIDICQQPTVSLAGWYESRGYGLQTVDNPSSRGPRQVLTLHPETAKATADLLRVLSEAYGIPLAWPSTDKVLSRTELAAFSGIVGHHHLSKKKWDVAPWVDSINQYL